MNRIVSKAFSWTSTKYRCAQLLILVLVPIHIKNTLNHVHLHIPMPKTYHVSVYWEFIMLRKCIVFYELLSFITMLTMSDSIVVCFMCLCLAATVRVELLWDELFRQSAICVNRLLMCCCALPVTYVGLRLYTTKIQRNSNTTAFPTASFHFLWFNLQALPALHSTPNHSFW